MKTRTTKHEDGTESREVLTSRYEARYFEAGMDEFGDYCYAQWCVVEVETGEVIDSGYRTQAAAEKAAEELNWVEDRAGLVTA